MSLTWPFVQTIVQYSNLYGMVDCTVRWFCTAYLLYFRKFLVIHWLQHLNISSIKDAFLSWVDSKISTIDLSWFELKMSTISLDTSWVELSSKKPFRQTLTSIIQIYSILLATGHSHWPLVKKSPLLSTLAKFSYWIREVNVL